MPRRGPFLQWLAARPSQSLEVLTVPQGTPAALWPPSCPSTVVLVQPARLRFRLVLTKPLPNDALPATWAAPGAIQVEWSMDVERRLVEAPVNAALESAKLSIWSAEVPAWSRLRARLLFAPALSNEIPGLEGFEFDTTPTPLESP